MNVKPLGDRIIVERIDQEEKSAGGIIILDNSKETAKRGKVLAVGAGKIDDSGKRVPVDVAVGDTVLFTKLGGSEITVEGKSYLILKEDDIYCIIENAGAKKAA